MSPPTRLALYALIAGAPWWLPGCPSGGVAVAPPPAMTLPVAELSGLAIGPAGGGGEGILAVGDDDDVLIGAPLTAGGVGRATVARLGHAGRELEAVAVDAEGRVYVLDEPGARVHALAVGPEGARLLHSWQIVVPDGHPLHAAWARDDNARGEGLLVLGGGRFLIAKQKRPMALIELGPPGTPARGVTAGGPAPTTLPPGGTSTLVPLAWWRAAGDVPLSSLNDLARGPDGGLYAVGSKPSPRVVRVRLPLTPNDDRFEIEASWALPALGDGKAEALAITRDGRAVVGYDADRGAPNLLIVPLRGLPR